MISHSRIGMLVAVSLAFGALRVEAPRRPMDSARADLERLAEVNGQPPVGAAQLRVHLRTTPDSAYDAVTRHLIERGYKVRDGETLALTTGDRYVGGVGMVRLHARVMPDSIGTVVQLSGEWRRLRRLLIVSAMAKDSVVIAYGAGGSRGAQAWNELTDLAGDLGGVMTYATATRP